MNERNDIDVVAINDLADNDVLSYLLKYDTVMGRFNDTVETEGDILKTSSNTIKMLNQRDPSQLPWAEIDVDIVIEATGIFCTRHY
tara:strand:- start:157 stop:414 length:258 start_codon:yes stop_codon:yes gene_type:complete